MERIRIGLVGIGKIAHDQHIPAIAANADFELVASASRNARLDDVTGFSSIETMLEGCAGLDAITICTPPQVHFGAARLALEHGKHVFLEKPPCATTSELDQLAALARRKDCTLFQSWHSRHAAAVGPVRRWLRGRAVRSVRIVWKEDVRHWHPGQTWIWEAGGFGVFDPGINAISILTTIVDQPIRVQRAVFQIPENCAAPIAADVDFITESGAAISAALDFRHTGVQTWDIDVETDRGTVRLAQGGSQLFQNGERVTVPESDGEYPSLYRRFVELIRTKASDVDAVPFQLVADTFLIARHVRVERFD